MKGLAVLLVVLGAAIFLLPYFGVHIHWLYQLGDARSILAFVLVLIGAGVFFFSSYE